MNKNMDDLKKEYQDIPIPDELESVVEKSLRKKPRRGKMTKSIIGIAAATAIFVGGINVNPIFAQTVKDIPILGSVINVLTFTEYTIDEKTYHADIEVPKIENLGDESLQATLNQKYLEESKDLYAKFQAEIEDLGIESGAHLGVDSGYEVKTDTDQIFSLERYVVEVAASASTTLQFDTIDKVNKLLITLPSLFKDDSYIDVISNEIKEQMITQMEKDPNKIYFVKTPDSEEDVIGAFETIKPDQNFYITADNKLVIVFNDYEVAPGYMGVSEFTIPTDVLDDVLVSHEYIK